MKKITSFLILLTFLTTVNIFYSQTLLPQYRIVNTFHLQGNDGWDALTSDEATGRLFVSHGTLVQVVDETNGNLLGTIQDTKGVHDIAIATDLNKGFISCGRDSTVVIFDLQTLNVLDKINIGARNPDAILFDPYTQRVFTFNGGSSNSTVINAQRNEIIGTIPLDGKPEFSVSDGNGKIYVNLEDKSMIAVINPTAMYVEQQWSVAPGESPSGIALDNDNHRLFSACGNKMMVILDAVTGSIITTLPIGERVDGAAFDPVLKRAYSSNGEGTLTVIEEVNKDTFKVLENFSTQKGARTITVDTKTHHVFLPTAEFGPAPEPTADNPHPRPTITPDSFIILDIEPGK
jgi:DNA-binding beta-propeller fold protein YncE